jgi:hypothetical protein
MNYIELYNSLKKLLSKHPDKFKHNDSQELIDSVLSSPKIDLHIYLNHKIFGYDLRYKHDVNNRKTSLAYFKDTDLYNISGKNVRPETKLEMQTIYNQISNIINGRLYYAKKNNKNAIIIPNTNSGLEGECVLIEKGIIFNSVKVIESVAKFKLTKLEKINIE